CRAHPYVAVSATHRGAPRRDRPIVFPHANVRALPGRSYRRWRNSTQEIPQEQPAPTIRLYSVIVRELDVKKPVRNFAPSPSRSHKVLTRADGIRRFRGIFSDSPPRNRSVL